MVLLVLLAIETVAGAILVTWVFAWLQGFPLGLALGLAGTAATTLVVNVPTAIDPVVKQMLESEELLGRHNPTSGGAPIPV
jgi:hypothetical protein